MQMRNDIRWHLIAGSRLLLKADCQRGVTTSGSLNFPASGKSTIAVAVERALVESGDVAYLLDGDNISARLGHPDSRQAIAPRTSGRVGHLTRLFADAGAVALASPGRRPAPTAISPARSTMPRLPFIEVYVSTPVEECAKRDPKGLGARARSAN